MPTDPTPDQLAEVKAMRAEARVQYERFRRLPSNRNGHTTTLRGGSLDGLPWHVREGAHPVGSSYGIFINVDACPMVQLNYARRADGHWHFTRANTMAATRTADASSAERA